jgi:hypothetical protein
LFEEIITSVSDLTPALIMGLGLAVGIEHAFEPDHMAAVGTQLVKRKSKKTSLKSSVKYVFTQSSLVGVFWGAGHMTTITIIGFLVFFFALQIDNGIFSKLEFLVGVMLMFLGLSAILKKKFRLTHLHPHHHSDGKLHFDVHDHKGVEHKHTHKSYFIGLIHGLAGSGSLVAFTAFSFGNVNLAISFLMVFGIGSVLGMALVSGLFGLPFLFSEKIPSFNRLFRYCTSSISIVIGVNIIFNLTIFGTL